jgi:uncharacterized membrane protein YidH (DUF202 family)
MKSKIIGVVIIIIGIVMIAFNSFNFKTTEKVVDLGAIQISKEKDNPIAWSPILGVVLLIGGIVIIVSGKKSNG